MYNKLSDNLINRFGTKVYKLALDGNMTCPNRDGKISYGGCIFCSSGGSGEFCEKFNGDINGQIERAKLRVKDKIKDGKYIAYFQNYSNTYQSVDYLKKLFYPAIENESVCLLAIATRPDCLPDDVLKLLNSLSKIKPVSVELGLQTINNDTAKLINRGYELSCYDRAVSKLKENNIEVVTHAIYGLPNETAEMTLETIKYIGKFSDGIKLQQLQVLKNTTLEKMFYDGKVKVPNEEEYVEFVARAIEVLPQNIVIHRITGDPPKNLLIEPLWCANKKEVLNRLNRALKNVVQGSKA